MKKAVLFKSKEYERIIRETPVIEMYFGDSPFGTYGYIDYGIFPNHYFIKEKVMNGIISRSDYGELSYYQLMEALTLGAT